MEPPLPPPALSPAPSANVPAAQASAELLSTRPNPKPSTASTHHTEGKTTGHTPRKLHKAQPPHPSSSGNNNHSAATTNTSTSDATPMLPEGTARQPSAISPNIQRSATAAAAAADATAAAAGIEPSSTSATRAPTTNSRAHHNGKQTSAVPHPRSSSSSSSYKSNAERANNKQTKPIVPRSNNDKKPLPPKVKPPADGSTRHKTNPDTLAAPASTLAPAIAATPLAARRSQTAARTPGFSSQQIMSDAVLESLTIVRISGNNRTKNELINCEGVVRTAQTLGGWHEVVLPDLSTVRVQRNALEVLKVPPTSHLAADGNIPVLNEDEQRQAQLQLDMAAETPRATRRPRPACASGACAAGQALVRKNDQTGDDAGETKNPTSTNVGHAGQRTKAIAEGERGPNLKSGAGGVLNNLNRDAIGGPSTNITALKSSGTSIKHGALGGRSRRKKDHGMDPHATTADEGKASGHSLAPATAPLRADMGKLSVNSLRKYCRKFGLSMPRDAQKDDLVLIVEEHFADRTVDEAEVISEFIQRARCGDGSGGALNGTMAQRRKSSKVGSPSCFGAPDQTVKGESPVTKVHEQDRGAPNELDNKAAVVETEADVTAPSSTDVITINHKKKNDKSIPAESMDRAAAGGSAGTHRRGKLPAGSSSALTSKSGKRKAALTEVTSVGVVAVGPSPSSGLPPSRGGDCAAQSRPSKVRRMEK